MSHSPRRFYSHPTARLSFLLALLLAPIISLADDAVTPESLLTAMVQAMQEKSYSGTFVYIRPGRIETMHIAHANKPNGVYERLTTLNGSRREFVRSPSGTACYLPEKKRVVLNNINPSKSLIAGFPSDVKSLNEYYHFELGESDRIADLEAYRVAMLPKDTLRYGRLFWIDQGSFLPLKYELINENGQMIERMLFTSIVMKEPDPSELVATTDAADFDRIEHPRLASAVDEGGLRWQVSELPSGFKLLSHEKNQFSKEEPVEHMLYSDGVASVSIFIANQKNEGSAPFKGGHVGGVNVYKSIQAGKQITVMGEVPEITVKMIGHNLSMIESHD